MNATFQTTRSRRGSVIVVVLITLMLASLMLVKFMETSEVELVLATRSADRERLRNDAYAALETALAVMAEIREIDDGKLHAPAQGWGDPYGYAGESPREGVEVAFEFKDESGRISLPTLKFDDMVLLAQALGLGAEDARRFSDGLYTWMDADHISQDIESEASRYERGELPHTTPKRSLRSWDELKAVSVAKTFVYDEDGALTPFGSALRENLSLYRYSGANINAITSGWLLMRKWDEFKVTSLAGYSSGKSSRAAGAPPWFRSVDDAERILGTKTDVEGLDAEAKLIRITISLKERVATLRLTALVAVGDRVQLPPAAIGESTEQPKPTPTSAETAPPAANEKPADEKLNYPFHILELSFDGNPAPPAPPAEDTSL